MRSEAVDLLGFRKQPETASDISSVPPLGTINQLKIN